MARGNSGSAGRVDEMGPPDEVEPKSPTAPKAKLTQAQSELIESAVEDYRDHLESRFPIIERAVYYGANQGTITTSTSIKRMKGGECRLTVKSNASIPSPPAERSAEFNPKGQLELL